VLVQVQNKHEKTLPVRLPGVENTSRLGSMDTDGQRSQVRATWWQKRQDEVRDIFLVEPQKQGRAGEDHVWFEDW
jgi:hypothetical protein